MVSREGITSTTATLDWKERSSIPTPISKISAIYPGIHFRVTSAMVNTIFRYPGLTFQPYIGFGGGLVFAHIDDSATTQSESDVAGGWNALAGLRIFLTPTVALFTEYKYTAATVRFEDTFAANQGFDANYRAPACSHRIILSFLGEGNMRGACLWCTSLLAALIGYSGCAESVHQIQRDPIRAGSSLSVGREN